MRPRMLYDVMSRFYRVIGFFDDYYKRLALSRIDLSACRRMLDCGCGDGYVLKNWRGSGESFGVDFSVGMLGVARRNGAGLLCAADCRELPFADKSFDVVFSSFVLDLFDDEGQARMRDEIARVLEDGGRVVLVNNARGRGVFYLLSGFYLVVRRLFPYLLIDRPIDSRRVFSGSGVFEFVCYELVGFTEIAIYRKINYI